MRIYLISDNVDTLVGMRLAGISGVIVHEKLEFEKVLAEAIIKEDIAIILITERLVGLARDYVYNLKLNQAKPLIIEIPDRHSKGRAKDSITKYVREAIGIKI